MVVGPGHIVVNAIGVRRNAVYVLVLTEVVGSAPRPCSWLRANWPAGNSEQEEHSG